ncbi:hypothetical protein VTI28DRAFT_8872 [Corynascus sepedonium]
MSCSSHLDYLLILLVRTPTPGRSWYGEALVAGAGLRKRERPRGKEPRNETVGPGHRDLTASAAKVRPGTRASPAGTLVVDADLLPICTISPASI